MRHTKFIACIAFPELTGGEKFLKFVLFYPGAIVAGFRPPPGGVVRLVWVLTLPSGAPWRRRVSAQKSPLPVASKQALRQAVPGLRGGAQAFDARRRALWVSNQTRFRLVSYKAVAVICPALAGACRAQTPCLSAGPPGSQGAGWSPSGRGRQHGHRPRCAARRGSNADRRGSG